MYKLYKDYELKTYRQTDGISKVISSVTIKAGQEVEIIPIGKTISILYPLEWLKKNHSLIYEKSIDSKLAFHYRLILNITGKEFFQTRSMKLKDIINIQRKTGNCSLQKTG